MFFNYPYTDLYSLNLDWIIKAIRELQDKIDEDRGERVLSFNTRTGVVTLEAADVNGLTINAVGISPDLSAVTPAEMEEAFTAGIRVLLEVSASGYQKAGFLIKTVDAVEMLPLTADVSGLEEKVEEIDAKVNPEGAAPGDVLTVNDAGETEWAAPDNSLVSLIAPIVTGNTHPAFAANDYFIYNSLLRQAVVDIAADAAITDSNSTLITVGGLSDVLNNSMSAFTQLDEQINPEGGGTPGTFLQVDSEGATVWGPPASAEAIGSAVTDWLDTNVPTGTTVVVDKSLTIADAAADSQVVGNELSDLKSAIREFNDNITRESYTWASDYKVGYQLFDISSGALVTSTYKQGYRVATNYHSPIYLLRGTKLHIPSNRGLRYAYSSDGTTYAFNDGGWIYGDTVIDLENTGYYVFIVTSYVNGNIDTVAVTNPVLFASEIEFYNPTLKQIDVLNDNVVQFDSWKIGFTHGTMDVQSNSWSILTYRSTRRITSDIEHPFKLNIGDVIKIPNGWTAYIAWRDSDGYHLVGSWVTGDYPVPSDGEYAMSVRLVTDDVLTENIDTIVSRFEIVTSRMVARKSDLESTVINDTIRKSYLESIARLGFDIDSTTTPPQQSIASYIEAYKHGYRIMLADVRWTSDLIPVAVHDASINSVARNADGTAISDSVAVSSSSLAELDAYDFGIIKGDKYAGLKVMRIADFVPLCKKLNCEMYLEIKNLEGTIADISDAKLDSLKIILDKYNIGNKCTFIVDSDRVANKIHAVYPKARIGLTYTSNLVGEQLTKRINWLLNVKSENDVFLYLYDETVMTGQISDDLIDVCTINGIGIEYTEIKTLTRLNTWLTDNNNLYCNRVAIRVKPIEYSLIDVLVSES